MRLGNHREAEQAAAYIGRYHRFTISGWTATKGGEHSATRTRGNSRGTSQSARSVPRVYEYAVEPTALQNLPENALLFPARGTSGHDLLAVECDPQIITLSGTAASLAAADHPAAMRPAARPGGRPQLATPGQPPWPSLQDSPASSVPKWPQPPAPRWRGPRD